MGSNIRRQVPLGDSTAAVASRIHTVIVLVPILAVTAYGLWFARTSAPTPNSGRHIIPEMYIPAIIYEWALLALVWFGVRRTTGLRGLVGGRWSTARHALADIALGFVFWGAWYVVEKFVQFLLRPAHPANIDYFSPRGGIEIGVWIFMAFSSGFCEEVVFRGYLSKQFSAWTNSRGIGVVCQAISFGAAAIVRQKD